MFESNTLAELVAQEHEPRVPTPVSHIPHKIQTARAAQKRWMRLSVKERAKYIHTLAQVLVERREDVAALIVKETGKPKSEAILHEILGAALLARHFARRAPKVLAPVALTPSLFWHRKSIVHHVPRGVVGIISPWNFPFTLPFGDVVLALLGGNAVIVKPSEFTPRTAVAILELVGLAGIDRDLVQVCFGGAPQGEAITQGDTQMVRFTGSTATGRRIAKDCAERLVPCVLELGGKDAAIVLEDADIEHAAQTLVAGAFANAGQVCASIERAYVPRTIFNQVLERVVSLTRALRLATMRDKAEPFDVGPMITPQQQAWVLKQLEEAERDGAIVHCGGTSEGDAIWPAVVTNCDERTSLCREETFGPVLPLMVVDSVEEAIRRANDSRMGLTAYVLGKNPKACERVAEQLEAGSVLINEVLINHALVETPWGGVKDSGLGHTHSDEGLKSFCELRHINKPRFFGTPTAGPFGYPLGPKTHAPVEHLLVAMLSRKGVLARITSAFKALWALLALRSTRR